MAEGLLCFCHSLVQHLSASMRISYTSCTTRVHTTTNSSDGLMSVQVCHGSHSRWSCGAYLWNFFGTVQTRTDSRLAKDHNSQCHSPDRITVAQQTENDFPGQVRGHQLDNVLCTTEGSVVRRTIHSTTNVTTAMANIVPAAAQDSLGLTNSGGRKKLGQIFRRL